MLSVFCLFVCLFLYFPYVFNSVSKAPLSFWFLTPSILLYLSWSKVCDHDSPDERSPEDIGLLFTVTDVSMP